MFMSKHRNSLNETAELINTKLYNVPAEHWHGQLFISELAQNLGLNVFEVNFCSEMHMHFLYILPVYLESEHTATNHK